MTEEQRIEKIKALIDDEFLERTKELARLIGWDVSDYTEVRQFVIELYGHHGKEIPYDDLEPYETE